ncbi:MAG TPA: O-antigen ligase family protein [Candidatus Saccharimonadales bacterium]|nr:O-antigen ligase family protein [Candidatus Saccharimonadales bacterium]
MKLVSFFNRIIAASFYSLFFFVPLVFTGDTSELFELNKMWLTWGLAIIIIFAWCSKMLVQKRFSIQRTPLDIPILLFLLSQIISTIFSLDQYVSFWGYYSRFNGGLLSTITYILLYYAFVSNLEKKHVLRILHVTLFSGLIVALWGLPSHFGYDPTCFVFRGNFDVACWTDAFQPKIRIFSTLGQPDWLAAYLGVLIPLSLAFGIKKFHNFQTIMKDKSKNLLLTTYYLLLTTLFYIDLLFTRARSGFIAVWVSLLFFFAAYLLVNKKQLLQKYILAIFVIIVGITFFVGTPLGQLERFTFTGVQQLFVKQPAVVAKKKPVTAPPAPIVGEFGGTDSGKIRLFVWKGALDAWKHYPLFGTGVETFAFAYYKFRPAGHNMTSEWEYLYNKAHNEYLNYLATTGIFGLGTYLSIILLFFYIAWRKLPKYKPEQYKHQQQMAAAKEVIFWNNLIIIALVSGFISILVSNFFGFSVVIINLYLFFIPALVFRRENLLKATKIFTFPKTTTDMTTQKLITSPWQFIVIFLFIIVSGFMLVTLIRYWAADKMYAYGYNLDHAGYYQQGNTPLRISVQERPGESTFSDELSSNDVVLATAYAQKDATVAAQLAQESVQLSNQNIADHPNNIVYWKTRVRIFYSLAQLNSQYGPEALHSIQRASELAPTDAKIIYNLGLLYSQTGNLDKAIQTMQRAIALKPDYRDVYYALGLFYRQKAIDKNGKIIDTEAEQNAVEQMHFILQHFDPTDKQTLEALKNWGEK